jgi:hypothetical protein
VAGDATPVKKTDPCVVGQGVVGVLAIVRKKMLSERG